MRKIKTGLFLSSGPVISKGWEAVKKITLLAEELNFDSVWIGDHIASRNFKLESWTALTALSTVTNKIRLGHLALCNSFRHQY